MNEAEESYSEATFGWHWPTAIAMTVIVLCGWPVLRLLLLLVA